MSLDQVAVDGAIADLDDPRFGMENGKLGYFDIYTFLWKVGPGIYFLEPYDPDKIPVLFVHGALGYPQSFGAIVESLDRTRFQPWFFYYPSGADLDRISDFLSQQRGTAAATTRFRQLVVVAHSMGGLVSRSFILEHHEQAREDPVRLFVSISTPWSGVASAARASNSRPSSSPRGATSRPTASSSAPCSSRIPRPRRRAGPFQIR